MVAPLGLGYLGQALSSEVDGPVDSITTIEPIKAKWEARLAAHRRHLVQAERQAVTCRQPSWESGRHDAVCDARGVDPEVPDQVIDLALKLRHLVGVDVLHGGERRDDDAAPPTTCTEIEQTKIKGSPVAGIART
jgi:hypothetical protein